MTGGHAFLVVDDHRVFAEGLVAVLRLSFPEVNFSIATSAEEALRRLDTTPRDLVITDISMTGMSGLELAVRLKKDYPATRVLILSMHNEQPIVKAAADTEAEGFVLKSASAAEITQAIKDVLAGRTHYSREVLQILLEEARKEKQTNLASASLTDREREVLALIMEEHSSDAIAERLFISKRTVDTHRASILAKTGCTNLISLFKYAVRNGLAEPPPGSPADKNR